MSYYYYKLKCVYCMEEIKPEEVVYRYQNRYENGISLEKKGAIPVFGKVMLPKSFYSDCDKKIINEENARKEMEYPFFKNNMIASDIPLITGYKYKGEKLKRRCPHCNSLLLDDAGVVPIFNVSMIGFSTVGKTVMLVMQYLSSQNRFSNSRQNFNVYGGTVKIEARTTHLENDVKDEIAIASKNFFDDKIILGTTGVIPPPHCMVASYNKLESNGGASSDAMMQCVICFRDVVGESYTADGLDHEEEFDKMCSFCQESDGIFILSDCTKLKRMYEIKNPGKQMRMDNPVNVLADKITEKIFNGLVAEEKPTVSIVSKIDELQAVVNNPEYSKLFLGDAESPRDDQDKRMNKHSAALAMGQNFVYRENVVWYNDIFNAVNNATKDMLMFLDDNGVWYNSINTRFKNIAYFPVSSIGGDVDFIEVLNDKRLDSEVDKRKKEEIEKRKKELTEDLNYNLNNMEIDENIIPLPISPEVAARRAENAVRARRAAQEKLNVDVPVPSDEEIREMVIKEGKITSYNKRIISKKFKNELDKELKKKIDDRQCTRDEITKLEIEKGMNPIDYVKPRCLELPLLYLLMKFGIIPDMSNPGNYDINTIQQGGFHLIFVHIGGDRITEIRFSEEKYREWLDRNQQIPVDTATIAEEYKRHLERGRRIGTPDNHAPQEPDESNESPPDTSNNDDDINDKNVFESNGGT